MHIKQLEHLIALAETGSFSRAAERLHITQSALSRSIRGLEEDLDGMLVDRIGKRNELTPLGVDVVARARQIVRDAAELRRGAKSFHQGVGGSLRVGLGSGPAALMMTPLLCMAAQQHPSWRVAVTQGPVDMQVLQLRSRKLDAMVVDMRRVVPAADLNIESMGEFRAGFIAHAQHPLARKRSVHIQDIARYPVASTPLSDEVVRLLVDTYGLIANPAELVSLTSDDVTSLLATVAQTQAIFMGITAAAREGLQRKQLREIAVTPPLNPTARYALVTLARRTEAPAVAMLRQFARDHLRSRSPSRTTVLSRRPIIP